MNIDKLDLNLLKVFLKIYELKSLSAVAENLNLSQPAVSHNLKKLRDSFNDPVFVRSNNTMVATPLAQSIYEPVQSAFALLNAPLEQLSNFNHETCNDTIKIAISDYDGIYLLPIFAEYFSIHSPHLHLDIRYLDADNVHNKLASGQLDFAIGSLFNVTDSGLYQTRLFEDDFVCITSKNYHSDEQGFGVQDYIDASHVVFAKEEKGGRDVDKYLSRKNLKRTIAMKVPYAANIVKIVERTEHICSLPTQIAQAYCEGLNVHLFEFPFEIPRYQVNIYWHQRTDCSAAHKWFRQTCKSLLIDD